MAAELVPAPAIRRSTGQFVPGSSGNPSGRPKGAVALQQRIRRETKDGKVIFDYLVGAMLTSRSPKERIDAATLLLAYGFGRPVQPAELTGTDGGAITFRVVYEDREFDGRDG